MELTFVGVIQLVIGMAILLRGSLRASFAFLMISGLFDGSAAILLPALGGSSIPPIQFAILFVYLRMLLPGSGHIGTLSQAIAANLLLLGYTIYGIAMALVGPRLFAGSMNVVPMRVLLTNDLFATIPLYPSPQNITAIVYLVGTLTVAWAAYQVCLQRKGVSTIISTAIFIAWMHVALGAVVALTRDTAISPYFELFRNGNYAQLDQQFGNFARIRGLFPESSGFAAFGFAYFVLNAELWYRDIRPRATGAAALALAIILFLSTSSTAYIGLAGYAAYFTIRSLALPALLNPAKLSRLALGILALSVFVSIMVLVVPRLGTEIANMVLEMTVGKKDTDSGQQRLFWAMQGLEAFKNSYGLGIGPGSMRSSSLFMAMLGTTGIFGIGLFFAYLLTVYQPTRASTMGRTADVELTVGGAFATAAVLMLLPAAVISPHADPGATFALFAGAAVALRPGLRRRRSRHGGRESNRRQPEAPRPRDRGTKELEDAPFG